MEEVQSKLLADLVEFARLEQESGDIEPWAAVLGAMDLDEESALWAVKLYNAYDDLGSAERVRALWPSPKDWAEDDEDHLGATGLPISGERRNLRGGLVRKHLNSYAGLLAGQSQASWLTEAVPAGVDPYAGFRALMPYLQRVWGVGRLTAFEWAEFAFKVHGLSVEPPDACLWESSGPRESLQRLYGNDAPDVTWLNERANECQAMLQSEGVYLTWWDFETVICDFNVMRKGRYYPGKHLAMIREEIEGLDSLALRQAFRSVIPEPWRDIPPGVDKTLNTHYRDTGTIRTPLEVL